MLAVSTLDITLSGTVFILALVVAAVWLARHDRVTRVKLGIFFEREREKEEDRRRPPPSEHETKIMGPWPGQERRED